MRLNEPLISVIVPIYQIDRYLGTCIESIMGQTYKNLEIILVDDGSTDRSPDICDLYAQKDKRIKVIHKKNGGLVSARKAGLCAASGEYIGYVDGDDWIGPGFYEGLYSAALESNAEIVIAGYSRDLFGQRVYVENNISVGIYEGERLEEIFSRMISDGDFYKPGVTTYVWNKLFKHEVLDKCQMFVDDRISIGEDAAVTYPALVKCRKICVIDSCAYHYRQREDSMLKKSRPFEEEKQGLTYLYKHLSRFADDCHGRYHLQQQVDDFVLSICIIRSGGILKIPGLSYMAYGNSMVDKNVIVYSAGTFGQQLVGRMKETGYCNVVRWIDEDYREYRRCCMNIDPVESISEIEYDFILIATVNRVLSGKIREKLFDFGISPKKILEVECRPEDRNRLVLEYLSIR